MFSKESIRIYLQLFQTWQVLAATVVLILFAALVNYVSRTHHHPLFVSGSKPKKAKAAKDKPVKEKKKPVNTNDELGLEEG